MVEKEEKKERNALWGISTGGRRSPFPLTYEESLGGRPWYQLPEWKKDEIYKKRDFSVPQETEDTKPQE